MINNFFFKLIYFIYLFIIYIYNFLFEILSANININKLIIKNNNIINQKKIMYPF